MRTGIKAPAGRVRVVGTELDVRPGAEGGRGVFSLTVDSGSVRFANVGDSMLSKRSRLLFHRSHSSIFGAADILYSGSSLPTTVMD